MKSKSKAIWVFLIVLFLVTSTINVHAETNQEKLKRIQDEIAATRSKITQIKNNINALVEEINKIDSNIQELEDEIDSLNNQIEITQQSLDKTKQELDAAEKEREEHKKVADERIKLMYMYGSMDYVQILFASQSITDLISRIDAIKTLTNYDKGILDELLRIENEIAEKKQKIEDDKKALVDLKQESEKTIATQLNAKNGKQELMKAMYDDKSGLEAELKAEEAESAAVQKLILAEMDPNRDFQNKKGYYLWPTPGYKHLTSPFGYRIHPIYGYKIFHAGVDIGAANKSKIISPGNGIVILARYYGGYGNAVIIDMGGGVTMLFGHCSSLNVKKGDYVVAGQIIAHVGSTGVSTGPHLHFEVRKNGTAVNPMYWVIY
jgi:murein DD-endopeptidase MepM/ murein hydrolase activator NlpD